MYDYGECHVCGGRMAAKRIKQEFWIKGKLMVIEGVPAGVCPQCGDRFVQGAPARVRCRTCAREFDLPAGDDIGRAWVRQWLAARQA